MRHSVVRSRRAGRIVCENYGRRYFLFRTGTQTFSLIRNERDQGELNRVLVTRCVSTPTRLFDKANNEKHSVWRYRDFLKECSVYTNIYVYFSKFSRPYIWILGSYIWNVGILILFLILNLKFYLLRSTTFPIFQFHFRKRCRFR